MKILFRTDASNEIGTGHVMRCATLAEALHAGGASIHFICRYLPDDLQHVLTNKGFLVETLENAQEKTIKQSDVLEHSGWLGVSQAEDATATLKTIKNNRYDWIIVDHYALDEHWETMMRIVAKGIMVIDDLADRAHNCDLLFDQNYHVNQISRYDGLIPVQCQRLIGPSYALLRGEFAKYRRETETRSGPVKSILVFFGGVDQHDFTSLALQALSKIHNRSFEVDVVIGGQHPNGDSITAQCKANGFTLHIQTTRMAELMSKADLAIGAGGGAVWERACLKLPTISIPIAKHQEMQLKDLSERGFVYSFESEYVTSEKVKTHVMALIENSALRHLLSSNSSRLVDGDGAAKIARILLSNQNLTVRQATIADEKNLYIWRNDPKVREVSFDVNPIPFEQHQQWFKNSINDSNRLILIGELNEIPVGVVRFDIKASVAEVSIYLIQHANNKGLGQPLLHCAEKWLFTNRKDVVKIRANVIEENCHSQRFFIRANYKPLFRSYEKVLHI